MLRARRRDGQLLRVSVAAGVIAAVVGLGTPASAAAARPRSDIGPIRAGGWPSANALCGTAKAIDDVDKLHGLGELMTGEFELRSAFLMVGIGFVTDKICQHAEREAHDILLNGIGKEPALTSLAASLPSLNLPSFQRLPTVHIASPSVSIGIASGSNVGLGIVPISIRWLQWGRGIHSVSISVDRWENGAWQDTCARDALGQSFCSNIRTAVKGVLHLTPIPWLLAAGTPYARATYRLCMTVYSGGSSESACARPFQIWTATEVSVLNSALASGQARWWTSPLRDVAAQIGVVSSGGTALFGDVPFAQAFPIRVGCPARQCVAYHSAFLGDAQRTLYLQGLQPYPLKADFLIYVATL
jgi:hypothetical protein